ncbi:MAG: hypothetical protein OEZ34_05555 [Spirochaetia bacterium]|nr:hypothetical protein [Spirochaetia bacterium]
MKYKFLTTCFFLFSCSSFSFHEENPNVTLGYNETAYRYSIIVSDEKIPVKILKPQKMPYSHNASGMVWIGKSFPYETAIDFITKSRNYYKELKYIAFFDLDPGIFPDQRNYELYIGAPTRDALFFDLQAWNEEDFKMLQKSKSNEEFQNLILSRYSNQTKNHKKRNLKNLFGLFHI